MPRRGCIGARFVGWPAVDRPKIALSGLRQPESGQEETSPGQQRGEAPEETLVSGSGPVVIAQQAAETLATDDLPSCCPGGFMRLDQVAIQSLVRPFPVIMGQVFSDHTPHLPLTSKDEVVERF